MSSSLCILLLLVSIAIGSKTGLEKGYYAGRSGDIILDSASCVNHAAIQLSTPIQKNSIEDTQVFNILANQLGAPRASVPSIHIPFNPLQAPKGNLFVTIEGLSHIPKENSYHIFDALSEVQVISTSEPYNPYSVLASTMTATQAGEHGIVHEKVDDESLVPNFFDIYSQANKQSTILSGSSSKVGASLLAPHLSNMDSNKGGFYWDFEASAFLPISDISSDLSSFGISLHQFPDLFSQFAELNSNTRLRYLRSEAAVSVQYRDLMVTFDLISGYDRAFFAEILFLLNAASKISMKQDHSTLLSFNFHALTLIKSKYGPSSLHYEIAIHLVDAAIHKAFSMLSSSSSWIYQIAFLPESCVASEELKVFLESTFTHHEAKRLVMPHIFLTDAGRMKKVKLCSDLEAALEEYPGEALSVFCPHSRFNKRAFYDVAPSNTTNLTVETAHIICWSMVGLIITAALAVCMLANIPPDMELMKDTASTSRPGHHKSD